MTTRGRLVDVVAALVAGIAVGLAIAALVDRLDDGRSVHVAHVSTTHDRPRIIGKPDLPFVLQRLDYLAHGGLARVEWYDGAWAPRVPDSGSYVSLFVDGERVASTLFGGRQGSNESRPGSLVWVGTLPPGRRALEIRVERADGGFAIPDASPDVPVSDGLFVVEWS